MFEEAKAPDLSENKAFLDLKSNLSLTYDIVESVWNQSFSFCLARVIDGKMILENFPSFSAVQENCFGMILVLEKFQMRCVFELLRCYRDNLFQSLLLLENTYFDRLFDLVNSEGTTFKKRKKDIAIDHFHKGKVENEDKWGIFDYSRYVDRLCDDHSIKDLYEKFFKTDLNQIEIRLNDYVHNNDAFPDVYWKKNGVTKVDEALFEFKSDLNNFFSFFISSLVVTKARFLQSGEFEDEHELGLVDDDSELKYEVNGFINFYLVEEISKREELREYLLKNVTDGMKLEF